MKIEKLIFPEVIEKYYTEHPEGLTLIEAMMDWATKVNIMVEHLNLTDAQVEQLFTDTLPENIANVLDTWYANGELATIINQTIFADINASLAQKATNIKTQAELQSIITANIERTLNVSGIVEISANITIPDKFKLTFNNGGRFHIKSGITLTLNCPIDAGFHQIFSFEDDTSIVTTNNTSQTWLTRPDIFNSIKLDWFGAIGRAYFNWDMNDVYNGTTDDTKAIKRALRFAGVASQKYKAGYLGMASIIVEARPSATYYVQGDNLLGCQDDALDGVQYQFEGNGSVFYHKTLTATDALIGHFGKIYKPKFVNFSVLPFGYIGRRGYFVNADDLLSIGTPGDFTDVIAGQLNYQCGYDVLFNITAHIMLDNTKVTRCRLMNCNKIYYNSNPEAMGWLFDKCYLACSTDNATYFHTDANVGGGFQINACEVLFQGVGQTFFKVRNLINFEQFKIDVRVEAQTSNMTFLDIDGGFVDVTGLNMTNGSGGQTQTNIITAKVSNRGFARFTDSIVGQNVQVDAAPGVNTNIEKALEFDNCNFLDNAGGAKQYPVLKFMKPDLSIATHAEILNSAYTFRKVTVNPHISEIANSVCLPIEYGGNTRKIHKLDLIQNRSGKITVNVNDVVLPNYIIIKSIKVFCYDKNYANVNKVKFEILNSDDTYEYGSTANLITYLNTKSILDGYVFTVPNLKKLRTSYWLDATVVSDLAKIPNSYAEIEYHAMSSNVEYSNRIFASAIEIL